MSLTPIMCIGFDKEGDADFAITATIMDLDHKKMDELRAMIVVAIGSAEDMWRRNKQKSQQQAKTEI